MTQELEISGKTVEQAIKKALDKLGLSREEVDVTVLDEGSPGILGMGREAARVRVMSLEPGGSPESELARVARGVVETLLEKMAIGASVAQTDIDPITFNIRGDDLGILIGRRGQTLTSLQYLVRLIISHQTREWLPVVIDVEDYKQRRYKSLEALACRMAEQVKTKRKPFSLEPMPAYERRIIHLALADRPDVTTESIGQGEARKVVIAPRGNEPAGEVTGYGA